MRGISTRDILLRFVPFAVVSVVHLVGLVIGSHELAFASKALLMPTLALALLLIARGARPRLVIVTCVAIAFSWIGDLLIGVPGGAGFLLGLTGFLLAHLAFLVLFAGVLRIRPVPLVSLVFLAWLIALLVVLAPYLGALFVPLIVYGVALGASTAVALGCNRFVATGAVVFLASDTILAFKFFYPGFALWEADAIIMLLYCVGQGVIVFGVVRAAVDASVRRAEVAAVT